MTALAKLALDEMTQQQLLDLWDAIARKIVPTATQPFDRYYMTRALTRAIYAEAELENMRNGIDRAMAAVEDAVDPIELTEVVP
jgi:hypothetical protein